MNRGPSKILIVRLGSLGDLVHALPAVAAVHARDRQARIDWVVDRRHEAFLRLVPIVDDTIAFDSGAASAWPPLVRRLRRNRYDAAVDLQGLVKSAAVARLSGAARVIGFTRGGVREAAARLFYTEGVATPPAHVIEKNLALVAGAGLARTTGGREFPLLPGTSAAPRRVRDALRISAAAPFAVINPGAGWPNKRWPAERLGTLARELRGRHALPSVVMWGPGEEPLASAVAAASGGAAIPSPPTSVSDLLAVLREAALFIGGDTGPLHLAGAVGTPIVGIYGPTNPARNGPWASEDETVSRFRRCGCHYQRRCRQREWCLDDVAVDEVLAAVDRRLAHARAHA